MIKQQRKFILILVAVIVLLAGLYLFALQPLLADQGKKSEKLKYDKDGDVLNESGQPFIYPSIEKDNVSKIKVSNSFGSYTMYRDNTTNEFVFEGAESLLYNKTLISSLYVQACYMLSIQKLQHPKKDLTLYGLSEADHPATVEIETKDGQYHKVFIGKKLVTGGAYYAKYYNKPYIYAVSTGLEKTLLADVRDFFTPLLAAPVSENDYASIDDFRLYKNRNLFVECLLVPEKEKTATGALNTHRMVFPAEYVPSTDNYLKVLESFVDFSGNKVVEYGVSKKENYTDVLLKYGINNPTYEIKYKYSGKEHYILIGNKLDTEDSFYAYSPEMDIIAVLPHEKVSFIDWNIIDFVDRNIFQRNINDIASIHLETPELSHDFLINGEGQTVSITENGTAVDAKNFRQFYIMLLNITMQDYSDTKDETLPWLLTMTVTTDYGEKFDYKFYSLSTRRVYYTVNGKGEFYVNRDNIDTVIANLKKVVAGETVNAGIS